MKNIIITALSIFLLTTTLIGCSNTVQGFGKDMQEDGKAIQKSAQGE